jgi:methyl coenzyme M reductase subunit D
LTDYAKFGKVEDTRILGLIDPKANKNRLAILSEEKVTINDKEER